MTFTKRGLRIVEGLIKFSKENPQYFDTANVFSKIKFTAANDVLLKAELTVDASMCNGYDMMHGGFMALIMDVMCLYGNVSKTGGKLAFTTNVSINFMDTANIGEKVIAEATTIKGGSRPILESKLYKENGCVIAKGALCFVNGSDKLQLQAPERMGFDVLQSD